MSLSISRSMRLGLVSQRLGISVPQIITATLTPATSALTVGQSLDDTTNWATFLNPANYASTAGAITSVVVNYIGDTPDAATPLADGALNRFSVTITDDAGNVRTFGTSPRTVAQASISFTAQPSISGTPTIGQTLVFNEGAAGPSATLQIEVLTLGGVDKTGELSGLTWDTSDETPGEIRYQVRATNSFGSFLSNLITADLSAEAVVSDGDLILTDNGNGTFTVTALPQPVLTLVDNGNGTITIQRII